MWTLRMAGCGDRPTGTNIQGPGDSHGVVSHLPYLSPDGTTTTESRLSRMAETQTRTQRFRGRSPPDRADWEASTVARRGTNSDGSRVCAVTGETVALNEAHFLVTLQTPAMGVLRNYHYDDLVVADGTLDKLDEWLEDDE